MSRHQFLHWLQNHTQLEGQAESSVTVPALLAPPQLVGWRRCTHPEVVEGGVGQAASRYVFRQLVQHLGVLGLRHQQGRDKSADKHSTQVHAASHTGGWVCVGGCVRALTCIAMILRGMSSRCCRMLKCHVFILIMSSNMNSRYKRPSTHTWSRTEGSVETLAWARGLSWLATCCWRLHPASEEPKPPI